MNAVLTVLVTLAILFAPMAGAMAMQCHERPVHTRHGIEQTLIQKDAGTSLQGGLRTPDHKSCCAVSCGFCLVFMNIDKTEAPADRGFFLRFAWGDQIGSGLTLPPMLGPPRLSV
ncbi:hypothetical protein GCM10010520_61950 [Rhizobium viscosum]